MRTCRIHLRGMALLVVISAVGVAAVLGYAMLASSSLGMQITTNVSQSASAEYLAESGLNLALFYLQHPGKAPLAQLSSEGYWQRASEISPGSGIEGVIDVSVSRQAGTTSVYNITSTGYAGPNTGNRIAHTGAAQVELTIPAAMFASDVTITDQTSIYGDAQGNGRMTVASAGVVTGTATAHNLVNYGSVGNIVTLESCQMIGIPTAAQVRDYRTYTYNGARYSAVQISGDQHDKVLGATPLNPAGIYWSNGDLTLKNSVTINGTFIVYGGNLFIEGSGIVITARSGFPALLVYGDLVMKGKTRDLRVNGLGWIQNNFIRDGDTRGCLAVFHGALLMPGGTIDSAYLGQLVIRYDPGNIHIPGFASVMSSSCSVKVISWR